MELCPLVYSGDRIRTCDLWRMSPTSWPNCSTPVYYYELIYSINYYSKYVNSFFFYLFLLNYYNSFFIRNSWVKDKVGFEPTGDFFRPLNCFQNSLLLTACIPIHKRWFYLGFVFLLNHQPIYLAYCTDTVDQNWPSHLEPKFAETTICLVYS